MITFMAKITANTNRRMKNFSFSSSRLSFFIQGEVIIL
jgi:hypothetical protein